MSEIRQTTVTVAQPSHSGIGVDSKYYKGIPGLLKLIETVCSLIAFLCVECTYVYCIGWKPVDGFFKFVAVSAFTLALTLWMLLLFRITKPTLVIVELILYATMIACCLIADIVMSLHLCTDSRTAAVVFGWAVLVAFCIDLGFAVVRYVQRDRC